jgi:hypothetical protein
MAILAEAAPQESGLGGLIVLAFVLGMLALWLWSVVWAYGDAERRGKSGCLVALLVMLVSWPLGLLIWVIFRPEGRERRY